jgi:dienelactone hydrolase
VAETTLRIVDPSRTVAIAGAGRQPRTVVTYVRYPKDRAARPFPLIVFGHGFAVTPGIYAGLLRDWARAGFVVAAPLYPLGNANAPGGPNESDLPNQPADDRLVITRLLANSRSRSGVLHGLINPRQIAVSGQSDGGDTALAVGYDPPYRDRRVGAVIVLAGAEIPFLPKFRIGSGGPALLAAQGGADTINPPSQTHAFYDPAPAPKFLLWLRGIGHLPPYTTAQPQLSIVARVSTLFLRRYLEHVRGSLSRMLAAGNRPGVASISGRPNRRSLG